MNFFLWLYWVWYQRIG